MTQQETSSCSSSIIADGITAKVAEYTARHDKVIEENRYFYLRPTVGPTNHVVKMADGREMIQLASYSYLGLIGHPRIDAAAKAAIDEYGSGAGGVRLLTGTMKIHEEMEATIAAYARREDACVYASGYVTNMAIITGLTGPKDLIIMDKLDHASIVDGAFLSGAKWRTYRHNDMEHLEKLLSQAREGEKFETILVIADSIFSMDGDVVNLPKVSELCKIYGARLMIDEAHSVGSLGATGHGVEEFFDMYGCVDLKMGTLSKAIPSIGGYLAGDRELIQYMRHYSRPFIFSAALPPAQTAAAMEAFKVIEDEPERVTKLHEITEYYASGLKAQGWNTMDSTTCVVPVLVGDENTAMDLTRELFDRNIFVCPIVFPAVPRGQDRLRTTIMATHTKEDIDRALAAFEEAGKKLGLI